jgi:sulfite oxidase
MSSPYTASSQIIHQAHPLNSEPLARLLLDSFLTPQTLFYVRTHGSIPSIQLATYRLSISGKVLCAVEFSLDDLRANFPEVSVTATLQCAGNRRSELMQVCPIPDEAPWNVAAISTAQWRGVPLRAVLAAVGICEEARHVAFLGADEIQRGNAVYSFGGSIPLEKAREPGVLLAYEMNGEPLTPAHGFPLRLIVPGYIGARSVKWLSHIEVQQRPSDNYFQQHEYKRFPPEVRPETVDWRQGEMLGAAPLNAAICQPRDGQQLKAGPIDIQGYAVPTDDARLESVELSHDGGSTWETVKLMQPPSCWTWSLWKHTLSLQPGTHQLVVRAWDSSGQPQPTHVAAVWNFKGYLNNAWHRIAVTVVP